MARPRLNKSLVLSEPYQRHADVKVPMPSMLELPEKVLQFGTGGFLRAFSDYFIDAANRSGQFNGRIVMVGSTGSGRSTRLNEQDGLYTLQVQGLDHGRPVETFCVLAAVSRALSAADDWDAVLAFARSPDLDLILSNTTEVGIRYDPDDVPGPAAPRSFPGKLTAVLHARAEAFGYRPEGGVVVLPCELIERNGEVLRDIVLKLAGRWGLGEAFEAWVRASVPFCNTLVDRIVPGIPAAEAREAALDRLGYDDDLLTTAEVYRLWPIQGNADARARLAPIADADPGVILTDDVTPFRERKVRILNGSHTISVPLAFLCGHETVLDMMQAPLAGTFVRQVMLEEIVPSLDVDGAEAFGHEVIDRFSNPYLRHRLLDITLQSTSKMRLRVLPSIRRYVEKRGTLPERLCFGFAAYLLFMRAVEVRDGRYYGTLNGHPYPINDDQAAFFYDAWNEVPGDARRDGAPVPRSAVDALVDRVCRHEPFWGTSLEAVEGFPEAVADALYEMLNRGVEPTLRARSASGSPAASGSRSAS